MKKYRKIIFYIIIISIFIFFLYNSRMYFLKMQMMDFITKDADSYHNALVMLLCDMNHPALLQAGREVLKNPNIKRQYSGTNISGLEGILFRDDPNIPKIIQDFKKIVPDKLMIIKTSDGCLQICLGGGTFTDPWGLIILPENYEQTMPNFKTEGRELIPGLWYYDRGLYGPDFDKLIDEIIRTKKWPKKWPIE